VRWLGATVALLVACTGLVAWVYLRDRRTADWRPPERQLVQADAQAALTVLGGDRCGARCAERIVGRTRRDVWLVRVTVRGRARCLAIAIDEFEVSERHGIAGAWPSRCAPA
jgi:hypothetical protein